MEKTSANNRIVLEQEVSLDRLELYLIDLPQKNHFSSSIGERKSREALIVKWIDLEGRVGYGECACRPDPYYSVEYRAAAVDMIQRFVFPLLKKRQTYGGLMAAMRKIRGWNFTKTAIEAAVFQIARAQCDFDLSSCFYTSPIPHIPVGISLGIYQDKVECYEVVEQAIADGFQRLKFKIAPTVDTAVFDHINPLLFDHQVHTGFDANGSFYQKDLDQFAYFAETYDTVIEQAFPPNRFEVYLAAKKRFPDLKICADEEVKHLGDLIKLHQLGAIDELNLKIGRVGGIVNSIEILNYCYEQHLPCWIGGMFETGVGRLLNLEFASHLPQAKAHDLSPSARYFLEDIISPEVTMDRGFVALQALEACEVIPEVLEKYTTHKIIEKAN